MMLRRYHVEPVEEAPVVVEVPEVPQSQPKEDETPEGEGEAEQPSAESANGEEDKPKRRGRPPKQVE